MAYLLTFLQSVFGLHNIVIIIFGLHNNMIIYNYLCGLHNITDYIIVTLAYETKEEVMKWMLDIQLGRRNLSPIQRIAVAEK